MTAKVFDVFPGAKLDRSKKYFYGLVADGAEGPKGTVIKRNKQRLYLIELDEPKKQRGQK